MAKPNPQSPFWTALRMTYASARRIVIAVVGVTVLLVGLAMVVLPGPAFIVIPTGLAILGAEFAFAKRWLRTLKRQARNGLHSIGYGPEAARRRARDKRATRLGASPAAPKLGNTKATPPVDSIPR